MANIKISQLTAAGAALGTQEFEVNESGTSKKVTGAQIAAFVESEVSSSPSFTGVVSFEDGSAAAPSITNTGDTNTGVFFPAADTVAVSTGGSERMRVDSTGKVGIGTSSPTGLLTIGTSVPRLDFLETGGSAGFDNTALTRDADVFAIQTRNGGTFVSNDYRITSNASGALTHEWRIGNTERMRIDAAGQIGIGGANYGTSGQVLTSGGSGAAPSWASLSVVNYQVFTSGSGTWTKPAGISANAIVIVEMWGAGGGGGGGSASYRGGGGGGFATENFLASSLGSTETVTVGAGGAGNSGGNAGAAGGNSTFGSVLTAYGGNGGSGASSGNRFGGSGGGHNGVGSSGLGGGTGGGTNTSGDQIAVVNPDVYGGGGGSGGVGTSGGQAAYGGGGGGGSGPIAGGVSKIAGNGGAGAAGTGVAGTAPAGGGGGGSTTGGAGARGEVRVWTIG